MINFNPEAKTGAEFGFEAIDPFGVTKELTLSEEMELNKMRQEINKKMIEVEKLRLEIALLQTHEDKKDVIDFLKDQIKHAESLLNKDAD